MMMRANHTFHISYDTFLPVLLGILCAFGPFVTDMYLPALPQLQLFFATDASMVQLSLSASMLGLAFGQIFLGPLSDKYGRKPILIFSLSVFFLATLACIFAPNIQVFIALRGLQGIGGAGGIVLSRSVASDRYLGKQLAKMMAVIGAINGVGPVIAPMLGGSLTDWVGWRGIFTVLLFYGLLLLIGGCIFRESLPADKRSHDSLLHTFASFRTILRNPRFTYIWLQFGCCSGVFFGYIASSPFIIQQHYGFSPLHYSFIFGFNAIILAIGSALTVKFSSPMHSVTWGSIGLVIVSLVACVILWCDGSFWLYESIIALMLLHISFCITSAPVVALNEEHDHAGAASALIGTAMFAMGGLVTSIVGIGDIAHSTGVVFALCSLLALLCCAKANRLIESK